VLVGKTHKGIYSDGTGSDNPYEKMRIKIERTRLAVRVDTSDMDRDRHGRAPGSPASSAGGPSCVGSDGYGYRWHGHHSSQGMASSGSVTPRDGASPSESPAQSWRHQSHCPPAMAPLPPQQGYGIFGQQDMGHDGGLGGGMGGMSAPGHHHGQSPMRGAAFTQMSGGGPCSNSAVIF